MDLMLATVLAIAFVLAGAAAWSLQVVAGPRVSAAERADWTLRRLSGLLLATFLLSMALRSQDFGVDTAAYAEFFGDYCRYGPQRGVELSFTLSALWLNAGMAGQCSTRLLPGVWAGLIVACVLAVAPPLATRHQRRQFRWCFAALLMFSMVGIELATNALRQGLSAAVMMIAISYWPRQRVAALAVALAAVALHASAALVLLAFAMAQLGWRGFFVALALSVGYVMQALEADVEPVWLEPLLFEIQKYLAHDDEEVWVRVLAFAALLGSLAAALLAAHGAALRRRLRADPAWGQALRVTVTCLPLLAVPYFGYRYVYGVYPVVLYLVLLAAARAGVPAAPLYLRVFTFNALVLMAWALGSSSMLEVPFFG